MKILNIPSSGLLGNNGPWPAFALNVGTPPQTVSVMAATSKFNIWTVPPVGCQSMASVPDCEEFRGGFFDPEKSHSFKEIQGDDPLFQAPFNSEIMLGYDGTTEFGTDIVSLDGAGGSELLLGNQAIASFTGTDPFLTTGLLGLVNEPLNITGPSDSHRSPMEALYAANDISSNFWAYNAGARYRNPAREASLTIGGYDAGRGGDLQKDALSVTMAGNHFRDLVVSIKGFSASASDSWHGWKVPFQAFIDSVVPDIWLPEAICSSIAEQLEIEWNATAGLYLLDESQRLRLSESETGRITLQLGIPGVPHGESIKISLPYGAFVSEARYPLAGIEDGLTQHYFALRPAQNYSQVYLGHAFLQEAYVAADYDENKFYVSQAKLEKADTTVSLKPPPGQSEGLSSGAIAGIAVGAVLLVLAALGLVAWFFWRPRWKKRRNSSYRKRVEAENMGLPDTQLPPPEETEMTEYYAKRPLSPDSGYRSELDATKTARGSTTSRAELDSPGHSSMGSPRNSKMGPRRDSYGFPTSPAELESRSPRMMHSRTASGSSIEPMSPLSAGGRRRELDTHEEVHELP